MDVDCAGSETSLALCRSGGWQSGACTNSKPAAVICTDEWSGNSSASLLDWSGDLALALSKLYSSQRDCDFLITVVASENTSESQVFCAHSLILSLNSEADFLIREGGKNSTVHMDVECLPYVGRFIRYLYSRRIAVTLSSVKCLHKIASAYRATKLQAHCAQLFSHLIPEDLTFKAQLELYNYALSMQDPLLEELCLQFLAWNCEAFSKSETWLDLSPRQLQALLSRSDVAIPSELSLLTALERWTTSHRLEQQLIEEIRFPMIAPEELFQLRYNLSFYQDFEAFFQRKLLQALEYHTVSVQILAQHRNLTEVDFIPRIYTSAAWSHQVKVSDYNPYYSYNYPSFQTASHPSFILKSQLMSWTTSFHPTMQSCYNSGLTCSEGSLPLLRLTNGNFYAPTIRFENKALLLCQESIVTGVQDFKDGLAMVSNTANSSLFPCPSGYSTFIVAIRPMYKVPEE